MVLPPAEAALPLAQAELTPTPTPTPTLTPTPTQVDTLLEICESQPSRQFIFITPQDMHPFLKRRAPMPRVVKMNDVRPAGA